MLVLSRKSGEIMVFDGNIVVKVLDIKGNRVHLGIDAPEWISVRREEVPADAPPPTMNETASRPCVERDEDLDALWMDRSTLECVDPAQREQWLEWVACEGLQATFD